MYLNGLGIEANPEEAAKWYRVAAEQGQAIAQYNLAQRLLWGNGLPKDERAAAEWLGRAAMQGHTEAICELGTLYRFGRGIEQSFVKAAELHVIAALAGDATAFGNLSDYYPEVEKAALDGSMSASLSLAKMYDNGLAVEKDKAKVLAWLRWGKDHGTYDADNAHDELDDMLGFYSLTISDSDKAAADALLDRMEK